MGPGADRLRLTRELSTATALRLLASVDMGRIAFTAQAMPSIRPVPHLLDDGEIIVRGQMGAVIAATGGQIVAYEADLIDPVSHLGWSVVVTGAASVVSDLAESRHYQELVRAWVDPAIADYIVRIHPEFITGFEVVSR